MSSIWQVSWTQGSCVQKKCLLIGGSVLFNDTMSRKIVFNSLFGETFKLFSTKRYPMLEIPFL